MPNRNLQGMEKVRDYAAKRYSGLDQRIVHERENSIIKKFVQMSSKSGDSVLDLPVGYGRFISELLQMGLYVKGVDASENMLWRASELYGEKVGLRQGKAEDIPFQDNSFDGFVSVRLLQHIHDHEERRRIFADTRRVATRWGVITLYTPGIAHRMFRKFSKGKRLTILPLETVKQELADAGWKVAAWKCIFPCLHCQTVLLLEAV